MQNKSIIWRICYKTKEEKGGYVGKNVHKLTRKNKEIQISLASSSLSKRHAFVIIRQDTDLLNSKLNTCVHNLHYVKIYSYSLKCSSPNYKLHMTFKVKSFTSVCMSTFLHHCYFLLIFSYSHCKIKQLSYRKTMKDFLFTVEN